jgi:hypothetical protein
LVTLKWLHNGGCVHMRQGRVYEVGAFERYLGGPCKECGTKLTRDNQSWGWRGACKSCRNLRLTLLRRCVICDSKSPTVNHRCKVCHADYLKALS